jgi:hypothetical protein
LPNHTISGPEEKHSFGRCRYKRLSSNPINWLALVEADFLSSVRPDGRILLTSCVTVASLLGRHEDMTGLRANLDIDCESWRLKQTAQTQLHNGIDSQSKE